MKIFVASFNRASNGAISKLVRVMSEEKIYTKTPISADYIMIVGDRVESFDFALNCFRSNIPIIHLWAGEKSSWATHDDVYRHAITMMSTMQLCTNDDAQKTVRDLLKSVGKKSNAHIVGNLMFDNLEIDESIVPNYPYDVVLYNPKTVGTEKDVLDDIMDIRIILKDHYFWIEPNGDKYSELLSDFITDKTFPRPQFLGLLKHCDRFITNSSCQYYEAPFVMKDGDIIQIGDRNKTRSSSKSNMKIPDATDNIIKLLRSLK